MLTLNNIPFIIAADVQMDSIMPSLAAALFGVILIAVALRKINQPYVVGYLLSGIILGPYVLNLFSDQATIARLGNYGVVLLLFFVGMEIDPRKLLSAWKALTLGTFIQVMLSVGFVWILGYFLNWSIPKIVLIGFVLSLSSTAVVIKLLQDWKEIDSPIGQNVLGILLIQDLAIVPMLIILNLLSGDEIHVNILILQGIGTVILTVIMWLIFKKDNLQLPFKSTLETNQEMQVFAALLICLGMAVLTGYLQLSTALGAFIGGMIVSKTNETQWVHHSLESFRVVFVALFFLSVGMLVNLELIQEKWAHIVSLTLFAMALNTFINMAALKWSGNNTKDSFYGGAILSQVGEFSFVIAAVGKHLEIISDEGYQVSIAVISLSLLLSPMWISTMRRISGHVKG